MSTQNLISNIEDFIKKVASINDEKLKQLIQISTFSGRIKFCDQNFVKLKAGSSRIAYDYGGDLVLKLAKNEKGIAQNRTEADGFIQQNYKEIVANVLDSDPNDLYIVAEKATKITPSQFKQLSGFTMLNFYHYLIKKLEYRDKMEVEDFEKMENSEFVQEVLDLMVNMGMPSGDMGRISSWGKVKNRLVLIDYGLTKNIQDEYYR